MKLLQSTLAVLLLLGTFCLSAQYTFQTRINKVNLAEVVETPGGDFTAAGWNFGEHDFDLGYALDQGIVLVKTNNLGDTLWSSIFSVNGPPRYSRAEAIALASDGGYLIGGGCYYCPDYKQNTLLIRTDENGDTLWTRLVGGEYIDMIRSICRTTNEEYIVVGETLSFGDSIFGMYIYKMNDIGDLIWSKKITSTFAAQGNAVIQNLNGKFVITGTVNYGSEDSDILLVSINEQGELLWTKSFGGTDYEAGYDICGSHEGGYAIIGGTASIGSGSTDVCLIVTDSLGNFLWSKNYGSILGESGYSISKTVDGGYVIGSRTNSFNEYEGDYFILKTDVAGNLLWSKTFAEDESGVAFDIINTSDGGYLTAGEEYEFMKLSIDGNAGCEGTSVNPIQMDLSIGIKTNLFNILNVNSVVTIPDIRIIKGLSDVDKCVTSSTNNTTYLEDIMELRSNIIYSTVEVSFTNSIPENISIFDVNGRVSSIASLNRGSMLQTIDASNLPAGIYFLAATLEKGIVTKKFVKL